MQKSKKPITKWIYWFTFAIAIIVVYKILDNFTEISNWFSKLFSTLMPFIMGTFIAYILYIPCKKVEGFFAKRKNRFLRKKARAFSIFLVYTILLIALILLVRFIIPSIAQSVIELVNNLPGYYNQAITELNKMPEDALLNKINAKGIIENIKNIDLSKFLDMNSIAGYAKGVMNAASSIFSTFVTFIISIYVLIERTKILEFIKKVCKVLFKEKTYETIAKYFEASNKIFFNFLSGQLIDALIIGILTSIAMLILGVKYAILLGVLIGISNLIPYFGAIIGVLISALITLFTGGVWQALWLIVIVVILQQIDANIINPKILGDSLNISPILVIFSVTIAGAYFGILGMFLSVPIATIIKLFVEDYLDFRTKKIEKNKENI